MKRPTHRYLIALGSNQRHAVFGSPDDIISAALVKIAGHGIAVEAASAVVHSRPLGPSLREYANAAAIVRTALEPPALLALLQQVESRFGRRRLGQPWRARTLDLDIVLWSGGCWADDALVIPHREMRNRAFVLRPAAAIAPRWRDPLSGLTLKHLLTRLTRRRAPLR